MTYFVVLVDLKQDVSEADTQGSQISGNFSSERRSDERKHSGDLWRGRREAGGRGRGGGGGGGGGGEVEGGREGGRWRGSGRKGKQGRN